MLSDLMDKNIVAEGGAKKTYCFGLKKERLGFAINEAINKFNDISEGKSPASLSGGTGIRLK